MFEWIVDKPLTCFKKPFTICTNKHIDKFAFSSEQNYK